DRSVACAARGDAGAAGNVVAPGRLAQGPASERSVSLGLMSRRLSETTGDECERSNRTKSSRKLAGVHSGPQLDRAALRAQIEIAVRAAIARQRRVKVVAPRLRIDRPLIHLRIPAEAREEMIEQPADEFLGDD